MAQPGSAPAWHAGGQGFESPWIHHTKVPLSALSGTFPFPAAAGLTDLKEIRGEFAADGRRQLVGLAYLLEIG